jgi:hypothetical protein
MMLSGVAQLPELKKPIDLSVAVARTPFAKLQSPPPEVLVMAPVPDVPYALLTTVLAVDQSGPNLNPVGRVAVVEAPIASKFCVCATPVEVMDGRVWAFVCKEKRKARTTQVSWIVLPNGEKQLRIIFLFKYV